MQKLKVCVKQDVCTGEALCTGIAPAHFELISVEGEHKAIVRAPGKPSAEEQELDVDDDAYDEILEAAERCPPRAIYVYEKEDEGDEESLIFP